LTLVERKAGKWKAAQFFEGLDLQAEKIQELPSSLQPDWMVITMWHYLEMITPHLKLRVI